MVEVLQRYWGGWCLKSIGLSKVELHVQKAPWLLTAVAEFVQGRQ